MRIPSSQLGLKVQRNILSRSPLRLTVKLEGKAVDARRQNLPLRQLGGDVRPRWGELDGLMFGEERSDGRVVG